MPLTRPNGVQHPHPLPQHEPAPVGKGPRSSVQLAFANILRPGDSKRLLLMLLICNWLGVWFTLQFPSSLFANLTLTNAIGLSACAVVGLGRLFLQGRLEKLALILAAPLGFIAGSKVAGVAGAPDVALLVAQDPLKLWRVVVSDLLIAGFFGFFFIYLARADRFRADLERERRRAAEASQSETTARLALLQAQIEPHFLFNTLANVQSLLQSDPKMAGVALEHLNHYLRSSIRRSRRMTSSVAEELALIDALLAIGALRLGPRLQYEIVAPGEARQAVLPPLLLQPLVENAIQHGIEPAIRGGTIKIVCCRNGTDLELTVTDDGTGLEEESPEGIGLSNVRSRLASLYGSKGRLSVYANTPGGVIAKLVIPYELESPGAG